MSGGAGSRAVEQATPRPSANAQQNAAPSDPANWPADVDKNSGFRLPLIPRDQLDEAGKKAYDRGTTPGATRSIACCCASSTMS